MLKQYTLRMPGAVFGGENSLDNLTNLVKDTAKVAVFTDKGIEATGLADLVTAKIGPAKNMSCSMSCPQNLPTSRHRPPSTPSRHRVRTSSWLWAAVP